MRKKLLIAGAILLALIIVLIAAAVFYVRSGRLDLLLQRQVIAALDDAGIRAEIGETRLDLSGYKVTLKGLRLFVKKDNRLFGEVDQITANFSIASYLRQEINLTDIEVVHPKLNLQLDQKGNFNLQSLISEKGKKEKEKGPVSFFSAKFIVDQGEIDFVDQQDQVTARVSDLQLHLTPKNPAQLADELNHRLQLSFAKGSAAFEGRKIEKIAATIEADVTEKSAQVDQLDLKSDLGNLSLTAKIDSFKPAIYELNSVHLEAQVEQVGRVFAPALGLSGRAVFDGRVSGTGADYHASGALESNGLVAEGIRVSGLRVKTTVDGTGEKYNAVADLASATIAGRGFEVSAAGVSSAKIKGQSDDFDVTGGLKISALSSGIVDVGAIHGNITADRKRVALSSLSADVLGGVISGSAEAALNGGSSSLRLDFTSIDLSQVATLAAAKEVRVRGTATGTADLTFPGLNYQKATGSVNAKIDGTVSPTENEGGASGGGELQVLATGNGLKVEKAVFRSGPSIASAAGEIGWNGKGSFDFEFKSTDMSDVQRAVESFGVIPQEVQEKYEIGLAGEGSFTGHADVDLDYGDADVNGHLRLASLKMHEEEAASFQGDINYSSSKIRVKGGSLVRQDGSRADFDLSASLANKDEVSIKANIQEFSLPAIVRAAVPGLSDFVDRGVITGVVDLKGLPGPRTIEGTANVTLSNGEFSFPSPDENEESRKVSVPEFTGEVNFKDSVLTVNDLRMKTGEAVVAGRGTFNLDTYEYSIDAGATNVALSEVSDKISENLKLGGRADVRVTGQGKWGSSDDWSELNLNASIEGRSVTLNGRDLGDAKLTAVTDNGLLKIEALGKIAEQMRNVNATVDLRDRNNYPINASIEFNDTDIGPYLNWISSELSGISGRATGSIKLGGPLQRPDDVQVVATISKLEIGGALGEGRPYRIANQGDLVVKGGSRGITVEHAVFTGEGTSVAIEGGLEREGNGKTSLSIDGEINMRLLSSLTPVVFATGIAQVQASIAGSLESPQLLGVMNLKDVGVRILDFPISASHGNGEIRFTSNQALVERFVATTPGGGSITIGGGAALAGLVPDRWRLDVKADQVAGEYPRDTQTVVDAELALQGNRKLQVLSGNLEVRRAAYTKAITLEELITTGGPFSTDFLEAGPGGSGAPSGLQTSLDLHIVADNTLIVKNNLADAVGSAYLNVRGSLDEPAVSGRVLLTRGTLEFRNGRYELVRGLITIPGRRDSDVVVDFQTEADIRGYHVTISFNGTIAKLQTQVRSEPELPEADIISLVLTGSVSSDRSTVATTSQTGLGLAQSILSASLSEQLERGTQRLFGLSRFSIDPLLVGRGNDPTARITIGQRVTKDLTVTYSQNLSSGVSGVEQVVLVEYRLSNRFSVVGYRNERGELGFDVRLRKRF
jgi:translocation and assembly module TamB